jgi:hypothetical protein
VWIVNIKWSPDKTTKETNNVTQQEQMWTCKLKEETENWTESETNNWTAKTKKLKIEETENEWEMKIEPK